MINTQQLQTTVQNLVRQIRAIDSEAAEAMFEFMSEDNAVVENSAGAVRRIGVELETQLMGYSRACQELKRIISEQTDS